MSKITDMSPMVEYFEKDTGPEELANRLVGISFRYAKAVLSDDDIAGKQTTQADDLYFLQELYQRLVEICEKNNICR